MCCGEKRTAQRSGRISAKSPIQARLPISRTPASRPRMAPAMPEAVEPEAAVFVAQSPSARVSLRYVRTAPMRVTGEASGREYIFSGARPTQEIDPKDMFQLLSIGNFSKA
jgi:hypothetical protein